MAIRNLDAVKAKIAKIPAAVQTEVKKATKQNAQDMATLATRLAPKKTGTLARSIKVQDGDVNTSTQVVVDAVYGRFVEFGTRSGAAGDTVSDKSHKVRKVKRNHPGTKAQPFFWPAYRALKKTMKGRVTRAANKAIKSTAGSGNGGS